MSVASVRDVNPNFVRENKPVNDGERAGSESL